MGDPPVRAEQRYVDHPQLGKFIGTAWMHIWGINEWSLRLLGLFVSLACFLLFLKILRGLLDDKTTLLAGLIFVLFPLTGYFGIGSLGTLMCFASIYFYLVIIGSLRNASKPNTKHKIGLALSLFFAVQFGWNSFFYAFAIGVHYVARCLFGKKRPDLKLLAILVIAPLSSLALNFIVMAGAYGWNWQKIIDLYKWRSAKGEIIAENQKFDWPLWFKTFWLHAETNFTVPIMITTIFHFTFAQLFVFLAPSSDIKDPSPSRRFPQFWLFMITPVSQMLILRGALWKHQTFERPFAPVIAIATALALMLLYDLFRKIHRRVAIAVPFLLMVVFLICCIKGTNYYHGIRWQPIEKIRMFKNLNQKIPPDKALLSYEPLTVNQHKAKGSFYRPEIAWYLDREIIPAQTLKQIQYHAKTGRTPYYLIPQVRQLSPLIGQLMKLYNYQYVPGVQSETKNGKFYRAGMRPYLIFDLQSKQ